MQFCAGSCCSGLKANCGFQHQPKIQTELAVAFGTHSSRGNHLPFGALTSVSCVLIVPTDNQILSTHLTTLEVSKQASCEICRESGLAYFSLMTNYLTGQVEIQYQE